MSQSSDANPPVVRSHQPKPYTFTRPVHASRTAPYCFAASIELACYGDLYHLLDPTDTRVTCTWCRSR